MRHNEETWWTIKFLKYYKNKFRVFFLFWRFFSYSILQLHCRVFRLNEKTFIKDKEILIKRKCHQAHWCVMSKAFEHLIETSRNEVFLFVLVVSISSETLFFSLRRCVMLYVFIRSFKTRQLVLTCASVMHVRLARTLKQLLWYIVALIMKWDAALDAILILKNIFFEKII